MLAFKGYFYEFHRQRIVSRPGQPLITRTGIEIGPEISEEEAFRRVEAGKDVYTPGKQDAYKLARRVDTGARPLEQSPHGPPSPSPTGREDVYYRHFHPGSLHPSDPGGPGHIYFGTRGENFGLADD